MEDMESVVTAERFAKGFTYADYIAQIKVNKDRFEEFYKSVRLSEDDKEFFRRVTAMPGGADRILVLGEDWCPDVFRGLPVIARIAEASGMALRIFPRDQNLDIMNQFLKGGKFQSIPTVVFFTRNMERVCHWSERPESADKEREQITDELKKNKPHATDQEVRLEVSERSRTRYPAWQQDTISEIRQKLASALKL
jgi:hypothetical protein